jgi:hypothetical protein
MRRTPEVVFLLDRALARGTAVLGLLNQLGQRREERGEIPPGSDSEELATTTEAPGAPSALDDSPDDDGAISGSSRS